jgi:ribosomal protein S18 acetylase RimI-like enzyme
MHPLDKVIWQALTTRLSGFADRNELAAKLIPAVGPLGAFAEPSRVGYDSLTPLVGGDAVALFLDVPQTPPSGWIQIAATPLLQMLHDGSAVANHAPEIIELAEADVPEMLALTQLTKPGPFAQRTRELGTYLGIRKHGALVAMAGERLRVPGHTEVSAVCTHPDHLGRGYAAALMSAVIQKIRERGETAFLHVRADNDRAIALYRRLGFRDRMLLHLSVIRRKGT